MRVRFGSILEFAHHHLALPEPSGPLMGPGLAEASAEQIDLRTEPVTNEAGIQMTVSNTGRIGDAWRGTFGRDNSLHFLTDYLCDIVELEGDHSDNSVREIAPKLECHNQNHDAIRLDVLTHRQHGLVTACPVVQTTRVVSSLTMAIDEWEHMHDWEPL